MERMLYIDGEPLTIDLNPEDKIIAPLDEMERPSDEVIEYLKSVHKNEDSATE